MKGKAKWILVLVVKIRHRANSPFETKFLIHVNQIVTEEQRKDQSWTTERLSVYTIHTHFLCFLLISVMNNWFLVRARIQELESVLLSCSIARQHYLVSFIQLCIFSQFIFFQPGGNLKEFINTRSEYTCKLTFI